MLASAAPAQDMTAGVVMEKMPADDRYTYVAGIVEGLATARYLADDKQTTGMSCLYRWFYGNSGTAEIIGAAFRRFPEHYPGVIVATLVGKECP